MVVVLTCNRCQRRVDDCEHRCVETLQDGRRFSSPERKTPTVGKTVLVQASF